VTTSAQFLAWCPVDLESVEEISYLAFCSYQILRRLRPRKFGQHSGPLVQLLPQCPFRQRGCNLLRTLGPLFQSALSWGGIRSVATRSAVAIFLSGPTRLARPLHRLPSRRIPTSSVRGSPSSAGTFPRRIFVKCRQFQLHLRPPTQTSAAPGRNDHLRV